MKIKGAPYHTIWINEDNERIVNIIDQRHLPHKLHIEELKSVDDTFAAIREMHVRGAPLIGVTAAFGMYFASLEARRGFFKEDMERSAKKLKSARPTAVDLEWAVDRQLCLTTLPFENLVQACLAEALKIKSESIESCFQIGQFGLNIIENIHSTKKAAVNILTHCNAGWLACVDHGTATAPIYAAHDTGIPLHVWVDETRPRNQGARLTAFELQEHGIPHTVIVDNAGGFLMQKGLVDLVITGADRVTGRGDVCNKIGTYEKALAAKDNQIPFYVAVPKSTIDLSLHNGLDEIPIEQRDQDEIKYISGLSEGSLTRVLIAPLDSPAANYAFDVTPARLVTGLITEFGICRANKISILETLK